MCVYYVKETIVQLKTLAVKNFGEFGKLQQFAKFFVNFHYFHNIPYANELQFTKVLHYYHNVVNK